MLAQQPDPRGDPLPLLSAQGRETAVAAAVPTAQKAGLPTRACGARALRRAARFADGWHTLDASPKKIRDAAAILRYRDARVTHIVIDPDTNALEQYLDDLERFAAEVRPLVIPQSERPPGSPMARQSDVLTTSMTRGSVE
jgi:alkanesulfonate monooxygenase SsuD/methylene tetrahydromethanopterin reductase-like flavin-dependent oxidoreductase (luciferase family)